MEETLFKFWKNSFVVFMIFGIIGQFNLLIAVGIQNTGVVVGLHWVFSLCSIIFACVSSRLKNQVFWWLLFTELVSIRVVTTLITPEMILIVKGNAYRQNIYTIVLLLIYFQFCMPLVMFCRRFWLKILVIVSKSIFQNLMIGFWTAGEKDTFMIVLAKFKDERTYTGITVLMNVALYSFLLSGIKVVLKQILYTYHQLSQVQRENNAILKSLDVSIISIGAHGLKYFNDQGETKLVRAVMLMDEASHAESMREIATIRNQIDACQPQEAIPDDRRLAQEKILSHKMFEEFKEDSLPATNELLSIRDLLALNRAELQTKIFCIRFAQRPEPEQEDGDLANRQFYRMHIEEVHGEKPFTVLKITDISINMQLQHSQHQKKVLEMVNACVSHEMRNPINSIIAMNLQLRDQLAEQRQLLELLLRLATDNELSKEHLLHLLTRCLAQNSEMQKHAAIQESSTKLLNFYVSDLLTLSQIHKKKFRKNLSRFNIQEAIDEVVQIQQDKISQNQIQLRTEFMGFNQGGPWVITDKMRLQQTLLNFQSNAIKFTPKRTGTILIRCTKDPFTGHNGSVRIEVIDNGVGISEQDQSKLFRLFGYLDSTKEMNSNGIGLGLYITKMIVEQFGGNVGVDSAIGRGSTFHMQFELADQENDLRVERTLNPNRLQRQQVELRVEHRRVR